MVGIGTQSNAKEWKEANKDQFPYPLILDEEVALYRELGIKRSVGGMMGIPNLISFAENLLIREMPLSAVNHYEGDDPFLNAGDFISDSSGNLVFVYGGENVNDRPSVEAIISALDDTAS